MHPAYSVILFTTASGAGYGLLFLLGLVGFMHGPASSLGFALTSMGIALGLITLGLLSSTFHLGHPERAWRAFSQWRTSWLSREGVAAVLAYVPAVVFGLSWAWPSLPLGPIGFWAIVMAVMAAVTVYCTAMIYACLPTIRQWHNPLVAPVYLLFSLTTGAGLLAAIAHMFGRGQPVQVIVFATSIGALLLAKIIYWRMIDTDPGKHTIEEATGLGHMGAVRQWETPHTADNFVMQEMGYQVARKHAAKLRLRVLVLFAAALSCCAVMAVVPAAIALIFAVFAAVLIIVAAVLERWLFFAEAQHVVTLYYGAPRA